MFESKFNKLFNLILEQLLAPISNNNFQENHEHNIRKQLIISKSILNVILTKHCIKNKKSQYIYHGVNYIPINKTKFFELVEVSLNQLFKQYSINDLQKMNNQRFKIKVTINSILKTFVLIFQVKETQYIHLINIDLITIFEQIKPKIEKNSELFKNYTNSGEIINQTNLKNINILEEQTNIIQLKSINCN